MEGYYLSNKKQGFWTSWYRNRQKKSEGVYELGIKDGHWISWYSNGQKLQEGMWIEGKHYGDWIAYNLDGTIDSVVKFWTGEVKDRPSF